jgi:hypothetical protein
VSTQAQQLLLLLVLIDRIMKVLDS